MEPAFIGEKRWGSTLPASRGTCVGIIMYLIHCFEIILNSIEWDLVGIQKQSEFPCITQKHQKTSLHTQPHLRETQF